MDNLQYLEKWNELMELDSSFKPYYKWIIFNILQINLTKSMLNCFKPYYKWIIFNMDRAVIDRTKEAKF